MVCEAVSHSLHTYIRFSCKNIYKIMGILKDSESLVVY